MKLLIRTLMVLVFASVFAPIDASAMPMFARKYGFECSVCHTTIPRLNETGYKFRAAGFRMPADIGKAEEKPFNLGDYFAARIQGRYDVSRTNIGDVTTSRSQLRFHEFTAYPLTGSFDKHFASLVELSFAPEEPAEVENGYLRITTGGETSSFETRFGIFHPFEGFGASDRPISISRPLFQTTAANFEQSTFFTPWGFDQAGAEIGIDRGSTSLRAMVFNGLVVGEEEGQLHAFPAQGGPISKPAGLGSSNTVDFQLFANHILEGSGGGVSASYYHGALDLPISGAEDTFLDKYDRFALYAGYPISKVLLLAGFQTGRDRLAAGGTFNSRGFYAEGDVPVTAYAVAGVRADWFDPATNKDQNELRAVTGFLNVPLQNGVQFIAEYQNKNAKRGVNPDRTDNLFQVRFIVIM